MASAGGAAARERLGRMGAIAAAVGRGQRAASFAGATASGASGAAQTQSSAGDPPDWARRLRSEQTARHHRHIAMQSIKDGDRGGAAANPDIKEREE